MKSTQLAQWLEVVASAAIIATLVVLVMEVRGNSAALGRQALLDRASAVTSPFFDDPRLAAASAKIRKVDGPNQIEKALIERYGLTGEEALVWSRHLGLIWAGMRADFQFLGDTPDLRNFVQGMMNSADVALYWDTANKRNFSEAFIAFVERVRLDGDSSSSFGDGAILTVD